MLFSEKVILFDQSVSNREEALTILAEKLHLVGDVKSSYKDAILKREQNFPTGLMTQTYGVAIPHCDSENVNKPQIGFMQLKEPVVFHQMGDNSEIEVKIIFMLALKKSGEQLSMLQQLMSLFQDSNKMDRLSKVKDISEFLEIMEEEKIIE